MTALPYVPTGYQMIRKIEISNFRGIRDVQISGAKRINVLVGPNGSGKTAFLEAMFLASAGSPEIVVRTRQWRGREQQFSGSSNQALDALLADTFRDQAAGSARVSLEGVGGDYRRVIIKQIDAESSVSETGETIPSNAGMEFSWNDSEMGDKTIVPQAIFDRNDRVRFDFGRLPERGHSHFIPARVNVNEGETAQAYSKLALQNREKFFSDVFVSEFHDIIKSVSILAPNGPGVLYGAMHDGRMLPLTMISGGVSHLAGILARILAFPKCVMYIDEIENGLYYERFESVWRTILAALKMVDGQIFVTTHSIECLRALSASLESCADEVSFIRSRIKNGEPQFQPLKGELFFGGLELGEMR